ncbi:MAG: ABC transporter permease [Candidatus Nezhaarchaeales archaeon]
MEGGLEEGEGEVSEHRPSALRGLWALTARELKKWLKEPIVLTVAVLQPVIWMALFGRAVNLGAIVLSGLANAPLPDLVPVPGGYVVPPTSGVVYVRSEWLSQLLSSVSARAVEGVFGTPDYFSYMAVGMASMIVVFTSTFSGMSIVWDRRLGFLDKVLSTPVPRAAIILSKTLSASLRAAFQVAVVLAIAAALGLRLGPTFTPLNLLGVCAAVLLLSTALSTLFLALALRSTRHEVQVAVVNLASMPLVFTSNTFVPVEVMPEWIRAAATVNPVSYFNDALRQLTIFALDPVRLAVDFAYLGASAAALFVVGAVLSWRYLTK